MRSWPWEYWWWWGGCRGNSNLLCCWEREVGLLYPSYLFSSSMQFQQSPFGCYVTMDFEGSTCLFHSFLMRYFFVSTLDIFVELLPLWSLMRTSRQTGNRGEYFVCFRRRGTIFHNYDSNLSDRQLGWGLSIFGLVQNERRSGYLETLVGGGASPNLSVTFELECYGQIWTSGSCDILSGSLPTSGTSPLLHPLVQWVLARVDSLRSKSTMHAPRQTV